MKKQSGDSGSGAGRIRHLGLGEITQEEIQMRLVRNHDIVERISRLLGDTYLTETSDDISYLAAITAFAQKSFDDLTFEGSQQRKLAILVNRSADFLNRRTSARKKLFEARRVLREMMEIGMAPRKTEGVIKELERAERALKDVAGGKVVNEFLFEHRKDELFSRLESADSFQPGFAVIGIFWTLRKSFGMKHGLAPMIADLLNITPEAWDRPISKKMVEHILERHEKYLSDPLIAYGLSKTFIPFLGLDKIKTPKKK